MQHKNINSPFPPKKKRKENTKDCNKTETNTTSDRSPCAVEHFAPAERHVSAVTDCFQKNSSLQFAVVTAQWYYNRDIYLLFYSQEAPPPKPNFGHTLGTVSVCELASVTGDRLWRGDGGGGGLRRSAYRTTGQC